MPYREDIGSLKPAKKLSDGRLVAEGYFTRSGVFTYLEPDGKQRREYRPPEEVFRGDSLQSYALSPVTDDHPPVMLTANNAKKYAVGMVGEAVRKDGDHVAGNIVVFDAATIKKMHEGKVELSCGYECDLVRKPGTTPSGEKYDAIQTNIRGNHIAIVHTARAGSTARVRMDAAIMQREREQAHSGRNDMKSKDPKDKLTLEAAASQVAQLQARADAAEAELSETKARADRAEGEVESLRTRLSALEAERNDQEDPAKLQGTIQALTLKVQTLEKDKMRTDAESPDRLRQAVKNRVRIEAAAAVVLGGDGRLDQADDRELMMAVVEKLHGVSIPAEKSDDYVRARFDAAIEGYKAGNEALNSLKQIIAPRVEPTGHVDSKTAREQMIERNRTAWKPKTA